MEEVREVKNPEPREFEEDQKVDEQKGDVSYVSGMLNGCTTVKRVPKSIFLIGDGYKNNIFIKKWLERYGKENRISPEYFLYEYEPFGKRKYHGIRIAVFNNIEKHLDDLNPDDLIRSIRREIFKLKKYNKDVILLISMGTFFPGYEKIIKENNLFLINLDNINDREHLNVRKAFINHKIDGLVNFLKMK